MKPVIEFKNLSKHFGAVKAVERLTLQVEAGSIFGFLGPNGAGKTTTISMMVNLIKPTAGEISIFGLNNQIEGQQIRSRMGYLAGDMALDRGLSGMQQLEYLGNLRGRFDKKYVVELAARLDCKLNRKFKTLSRGNKQKVGLIAALMSKPELLILDEPTSGLDPLIQAEFNRIILEHKSKGGTVFISSHILSEVQETCDRVAFIRSGKLVVDKPLVEITKGMPKEIRIISSDMRLKPAINSLKGIENLKATEVVLSFTYKGEVHKMLQILAKYKIEDVVIQDADLEEIFIKYFGAKNA